ncbi:MAG: dienelactone hydrolase family protein [Bacteroidales bacterium]
MRHLRPLCWSFWLLAIGSALTGSPATDTLRTRQYTSRSPEAAQFWQEEVRSGLFSLLHLDKLLSERALIPLNPKQTGTVDRGDYLMSEVEINSTPGRRIRVFVTIPKTPGGPWPAVVCIHGHGGKSLSVYELDSPYKAFAHELASRGYVTITAMVSQHEVYEQGMILMGERLWDLMRCVDYLEAMPEVDPARIGCAGLSLGGEMAMWLGGMDTRIRATVSAGFLTTMDHMEVNHCMCWKFPGLRTLVDYADIYALTAPRALMCQNGLKEPESQFYVPIAREAIQEVALIYRDLGAADKVVLDVHDEGHIMNNSALIPFMEKQLAKK